nr:hypothetical protein [Tanacetum cinerariifolium]
MASLLNRNSRVVTFFPCRKSFILKAQDVVSAIGVEFRKRLGPHGHDLDEFFNEVQFVVNLDFIQCSSQEEMVPTLAKILKDIPSFILGLTQEEYDMGSERHKEVANTDEKGVEAYSSRKSKSRLSIGWEVMVHGRRAVTLTEHMKSPFYVRVVNDDKVENSEEKWLANFLFNKRDGDDSDVLFKTKYGHKSLRGQIKTRGSQEPVDDSDKKLFTCDNAYTLEMFTEYAENAIPSYFGRLCWKSRYSPNFWPVAVCYKPCKRSSNYRMSDCACDIGKWKCGLDVEGKKYNTQLGFLRNKYTAKLLVSDCNTYMGYLENRVYDVILMHAIFRICYEPRSIVL